MDRSAHTMYDPQEYFQALASTTMKASVGEKYGKMTFRFKIDQRSTVVLMRELMNFVESLSALRDTHEKS